MALLDDISKKLEVEQWAEEWAEVGAGDEVVGGRPRQFLKVRVQRS